jgi:hypothetical protein
MTEQEALPPPSSGDAAGPPGSTLAIVSLVAGVLTWVSLPLAFLVLPTPLCMLAAIVCGHLARAEIRREPGRRGDGMAIAGLVLGYGMLATIVLAALAVVLVFGGIAAFVAYLAAYGH